MLAYIYSNAEFDQIWKRIRFAKHSDTTLQILGKTVSYSLISANTPDYSDTFSLKISTSPHYSNVKSNSSDYPLNTPSVNDEIESPVKVYSKTN